MRLSQRVMWARRTLVASWFCCAMAWLLIVLVDIESVLVTGPLIFLMGAILILLSRNPRFVRGMALGFCHIFVCLLFFGLVQVFHWRPGQAHAPFALMGLCYVTMTIMLTFWALRRAPKVQTPWGCDQCGYLLYGLTEPRCPECGTPFDPSRLTVLTPRVDITAEDPSS